MADTTTRGPQLAHLMAGIPYTASGHAMPHAHWYHLIPPAPFPGGSAEHVAVTKYGVYQCDSHGQQVQFTRCLLDFRIGAAPADALAGLDRGYAVIA